MSPALVKNKAGFKTEQKAQYGPKKAPGPDDLPIEVIRLAFEVNKENFPRFYYNVETKNFPGKFVLPIRKSMDNGGNLSSGSGMASRHKLSSWPSKPTKKELSQLT